MGSPIDLRECLNAISDVVNNRPEPLRLFDQIYMKTADMLLQTEHVGRWLDGKEIVCIGDGDAIGLCLVHLHNCGLLAQSPKTVQVLDFDERVVFSIRNFARRYRIADRVTARLYNVAEALPKECWHKFEGFYTNPPFGASNGGKSIECFIQRGLEATGKDSVGCIVVADYDELPWTRDVLLNTEQYMLASGFVIREMLPRFHHYHLDDAPELTSCSLVVQRVVKPGKRYTSRPLSREILDNFYGEEAPLRARCIRDLTHGRKRPSRDYEVEPWKDERRQYDGEQAP